MNQTTPKSQPNELIKLSSASDPVITPSSIWLEIGKALETARQERHVSIEDIAQSLKISPRRVLEIESGKASGHELVFTRGLARSYARLVQLDISELLQQVSAPQPEKTLPITPPQFSPIPLSSHLGSKPSLQGYPLKLGIAAAIVLLFVGGFILLRPLAPSDYKVEEEGQKASGGTVPSPTVSAPIAGTAVPDMPPVEKPTADKTPVTAAEEKTVVAPAAASPSPAATKAAPTAAAPAARVADADKVGIDKAIKSQGAIEFLVVAKARTWLQITNENSKIMLDRELEKGDSTTIRAELPAQVMVGDAKSVELTYQGKKVKWLQLPGGVGIVELKK